MGKKLILLVLSAILTAAPLKAQEKSMGMEKLGTSEQISSNYESLPITYEEKEGRLYYGEGGIDILLPDSHLHFDTDFKVLLLKVLSDVNNDSYPDFICCQDTPAQSDQVMIISGKDGSVIRSLRFTHKVFDDNTGFSQLNSQIILFEQFDEDNIYIISDYSLYRYSLSGDELSVFFSAQNNIWDLVQITDLSQDGVNDLAVAGQQGILFLLDGVNGELINQIPLGAKLEKDEDNGFRAFHYEATMNLWDLESINGKLYITSESGDLFVMEADGTIQS